MGRQARDMSLRVFLLVISTPRARWWGVAGWNTTPEVMKHGSAHCWVLRRHLAGWWVVFSGRSRPWPSNASRYLFVWVWWWLWGLGCGGVLSVA